MYLSYYGLTREPFHITPDPEFLFESPSHREAYAAITYGVEQRKGFIAVTGEVGTGKTTIVRAYLKSLDASQLQTIYVYSPDLSFDELLRLLLTELGESPDDDGTSLLLRRIQLKLIALFEEGKGLLLVIDEAQNMPIDTMEKLRTLSNLETTEDKLMQILLVGQPELDEKLNLHQLRQLKQRIAVRATLRTLTPLESVAYIRHRFERAGGDFHGVFAPGAVRSLLRHAKGSPRALNILCDNVLLAGFGAEQRPIRPALVNEVARDLDGIRRSRGMLVRWPAAAAVLLAVGLAAAGWTAWGGMTHEEEAGRLSVVHAEALPSARAGTEAPGNTPAVVAAVAPEHPEAAPVPPAPPVAETPPVAADTKVDTPFVPAPVAVENVVSPVIPAPQAAPAPLPMAARKMPAAMAAGETTRVVQPGENLTRLLLDIYGRCDAPLIRAVQARNPGIVDVNMILTGQTLVFPAVDEASPGGTADSPVGS